MNTPTINPDKLARFADIRLDNGDHDEGPDMCAMEAAAWLTDEEWSDRPACVSPVIGAFMRSLNDDWDGARRQQLKPYTLRVIGTAGDGQDEARFYLALDWLLRTYTPAWLDLAGLHEDATALRGHRRVVDEEAARSIMPITEASRDHAAAAWGGAQDAAWNVAGSAAEDAARNVAGSAAEGAARNGAGFAVVAAVRSADWSAAEDATWSAAWSAVGDAARSAAWSAVGNAAWGSSWDSVEAAARDAIAPTVDALQAASLARLDHMINPAGLP